MEPKGWGATAGRLHHVFLLIVPLVWARLIQARAGVSLTWAPTVLRMSQGWQLQGHKPNSQHGRAQEGSIVISWQLLM